MNNQENGTVIVPITRLNGIFEGKLTTLYHIMLALENPRRFEAQEIVHIAEQLQVGHNSIKQAPEEDVLRLLGRAKEFAKSVKEDMGKLGKDFVRSETKATLIILNVDNDRYTEKSDLLQDIYALQSAIELDLRQAYFLHIPSTAADFYSDTTPFGDIFPTKYPGLIYDSIEATKSLGLGQYTATVFHLMRVMESVVQTLATKLGITTPKPIKDMMWNNLLELIDKEIEKRRLSKSFNAQEVSVYSQASAYLHRVKDAWRNEVMHPKQSYNINEAEDVFINVRSFARHLSEAL